MTSHELAFRGCRSVQRGSVVRGAFLLPVGRLACARRLWYGTRCSYRPRLRLLPISLNSDWATAGAGRAERLDVHYGLVLALERSSTVGGCQPYLLPKRGWDVWRVSGRWIVFECLRRT